MLFDNTCMFWGSVSATGSFTFYNLATTTSVESSAVALTAPRDLGIGTGQETPQVAIIVGTSITASPGTAAVTINFQGSTNSTNSNFTTYESWTFTTASLVAGAEMYYAVPMRPPGAGLPLYYALQFVSTNAFLISTGTIWAGIVLEGDTMVGTGMNYPANFTVA